MKECAIAKHNLRPLCPRCHKPALKYVEEYCPKIGLYLDVQGKERDKNAWACGNCDIWVEFTKKI